MFNRKKKRKELENEKQKLTELRQQIEIEKQELLFIKEQLEDKTNKVDISNIYVWQDKGLYSIVSLNVQDFVGRKWCGLGETVNAYESTLVDIFSNNIVYKKCSTEKIQSKEYIIGESYRDHYYAYLLPLYSVDKNLLAYTDKKVPLYVLQQLYYRLNNVDINAYALKKQK